MFISVDFLKTFDTTGSEFRTKILFCNNWLQSEFDPTTNSRRSKSMANLGPKSDELLIGN